MRRRSFIIISGAAAAAVALPQWAQAQQALDQAYARWAELDG